MGSPRILCFDTLEHEISTLFARYTRVIANQKRRPQFEIIVLIIVKCNVEIVTKGDENTSGDDGSRLVLLLLTFN